MSDGPPHDRPFPFSSPLSFSTLSRGKINRTMPVKLVFSPELCPYVLLLELNLRACYFTNIRRFPLRGTDR